jgi:hypothetical protein
VKSFSWANTPISVCATVNRLNESKKHPTTDNTWTTTTDKRKCNTC